MMEDGRPRQKILHLLMLLAESGGRYTKRDLTAKLGIKDRVFTDYINELRNVGFVVEIDGMYRYSLGENRKYKYLKDLLLFTEEDRRLLSDTIDKLDKTNRGASLKRKLDSLYNYRKLGHDFLRRPYLTKLDKLEEAKAGKVMAMLQDYSSSNSNDKTDRLVEPFHIDSEADTLQAYDVEKKGLRHFRISRFTRVRIMEDLEWTHESKHLIRKTDPFRIVDDKQIKIHIRFRIAARNELVERFPLSRAHIMESDEEGVFDLQCEVNSKFYGLTNFILGFHHQLVEIVSPDLLIEHLKEQVSKMKSQF